jgi:TonB family protein
MPRSLLSKSFTVSMVLHAGFLGLLLVLASRYPVLSDAPLRVRILEPPGQPAAPPAVPQVIAPPAASRAPSGYPGELRRPPDPPARPEKSREPTPPPPGEVSKSREGSSEGGDRSAGPPGGSSRPDLREPAPPPSPRLAARPTPDPVFPRTDSTPEPSRSAPIIAEPEPSGLRLGGPLQARPSPPVTERAPSPGGKARPSLREQIASLGSGLTADIGSAKQTVDLNNREVRFVDYLSLVKRRIERIWTYPEEALQHGVGGDLLLVFTLNKAGTLTDVRLIYSSGFPVLDQEAMRAVKLAAPYDPFPSQLGEEPWNISASFHYNLPRRFRRN